MVSFKYQPMVKWSTESENGYCPACSCMRKTEEFPETAAKAEGWRDKSGRQRSFFCSYCLPTMADTYVEQMEDREDEEYYRERQALYKICAQTGLYYDDRTARHLFEDECHLWEENKGVVPANFHWILIYFRYISNDPQLSQKTFFQSDNMAFDSSVKFQYSDEGVAERLSEQDQRNRLEVIRQFHRDPFQDDPAEDRPRLYEDLLTMATEDIAEDLPKARAAIEIVRAYSRIDKINQALIQMQGTVESMIENQASIDALTKHKGKEIDAIDKLSKGHGFAERYANAKSKGSGTLTAIIRDMNDIGYDKGAVNKFDIETAAGMRQVAELSSESIIKQLDLTGADFADMVKQQATIIRNMQATMEAQAEELRLLKEEHLREELVDRYKQALEDKKINPEEIEKLVQEEMRYIPLVAYKE